MMKWRIPILIYQYIYHISPFLVRKNGRIQSPECHQNVTRMSPECHPKSTHLINPLGASGCPAENMNPYLEPIYSQLPRCLLSCPDPPMLPEGYKQEITFSGLACVHRDDATARHCFPKHLSPGGLAKHMPCWVNTPCHKLDIWDSCSWFSGKKDCTINPLMCSSSRIHNAWDHPKSLKIASTWRKDLRVEDGPKKSQDMCWWTEHHNLESQIWVCLRRVHFGPPLHSWTAPDKSLNWMKGTFRPS